LLCLRKGIWAWAKRWTAAGCDLHENSVLPDFEIAHYPKIVFIDGKLNSGDNGKHFWGEKGSRRKSLGPERTINARLENTVHRHRINRIQLGLADGLWGLYF
jgi:hypothetical protein